MKKFILLGALSVLFYAVPGYTMFRREGEKILGWHYVQDIESNLQAQVQEMQARELWNMQEQVQEMQARNLEELWNMQEQVQEMQARDLEELWHMQAQVQEMQARERKARLQEEQAAAGRARRAEKARERKARLQEEQVAAAARERRERERKVKAAALAGSSAAEWEQCRAEWQVEPAVAAPPVAEEKAILVWVEELVELEKQAARVRKEEKAIKNKGAHVRRAIQRVEKAKRKAEQMLASPRAAAEEQEDDAPAPTSPSAHGDGTKEPEAAE